MRDGMGEVLKWARLGSVIFDGIMQIIDTVSQRDAGTIDPGAAYAEIAKIDSDLADAVKKESDLFKRLEVQDT